MALATAYWCSSSELQGVSVMKSPLYEIEAVIGLAKKHGDDFKTSSVDKLIDIVMHRYSNEALLCAITALYRVGFRSQKELTDKIPDSMIADTAALTELAKKARWLIGARSIIGQMKQLDILTGNEMKEGFALVKGFIDAVKSETHAQRIAADYIFQVKRNGAISGDKIEGTLTRLDSGLSYGDGVQIVRVPWRILPLGEHPYPAIVAHFESLAERYKNHKLEKERLRKIFELEPTIVIIGEDDFERSAIFLFKDSDKAVLECPYYGNATYIIEGGWMSLSKLTKKELIKDYPREAKRKYHSDDWFSWLKKSLGKTITTNDIRWNESISLEES